MAILTAPFLPAKRPTVAAAAEAAPAKEEEEEANAAAARPVVDVPLHVHTGVWPLNMGAMPMTQRNAGEEPEQRLIEIDEIPLMTKGEKRLAREVELQHARLRCVREGGARAFYFVGGGGGGVLCLLAWVGVFVLIKPFVSSRTQLLW